MKKTRENTSASVRVGIVGVTGYTGQELLRLLLNHPKVEVAYLASSGKTDPSPSLRQFGELPVRVSVFDPSGCASACDAVFLCLPHKVAMEAVPPLLKAGLKVADLSADFRLKDKSVYLEAYGVEHAAPGLLSESVYGLPEIYGAKIAKARLVAVPGCYPTSVILPLAPLLKARLVKERIVVDSKSGATGAGKEAKAELMFSEVNENLRAYGLFTHRHIPEISQELDSLNGGKVDFTWAPHLAPMNRGILSTIYLRLKSPIKHDRLVSMLANFYCNSPFVRVTRHGLPETKHVRGTNFCDIGAASKGRDVVLVSAIDNLGKGAAGQAVQAFNLQNGLPETAGLLGASGAP